MSVESIPDEILQDGSRVLDGDVRPPADYEEPLDTDEPDASGLLDSDVLEPPHSPEPLEDLGLLRDRLGAAYTVSFNKGYFTPRIWADGKWTSLVKYAVSMRKVLTPREWSELTEYAAGLTEQFEAARKEQKRQKVGGAVVEEAKKPYTDSGLRASEGSERSPWNQDDED